jgi:hypothetical protein
MFGLSSYLPAVPALGRYEFRLVTPVSAATAIAATTAAATAAVARAAVGRIIPMTAEAVRAVDWLVAARLERHRRIFAALAAGNGEHLSLSAAVATAVTGPTVSLRSLCGTAGGTAPWLVRKPLLLMKRLLISAEGKGRAAIGTGKGLVDEIHSTTSVHDVAELRSSRIHEGVKEPS